MLHCTGPDGRTVYTDDKSVCPDAKPYEPDAVVHSVDPAALPAPDSKPARAALRTRGQSAEAGAAQRWRDLRSSKEDELQQIAAERNGLLGHVSWCNRGGSVFTRDEAGIKQRVRCNELSSRLAALETREAQVREYLLHGLAEDCRRAGCLPGWIR